VETGVWIIYDIIAAAIIIGAVVSNAKRGFSRIFISAMGYLVSCVLASSLSNAFAPQFYDLFLKDKIIYNEYGEQFTIDEFFNKEIDYCLYKKDNLLNGSEGEYANQYHYNDGLRFSKYTDFS